MSDIMLEVNDLKQHFVVNRKFTVKAVDGISFKIKKGETFGLVGESGSGKSTTGRSIIRLYKPTSGEIIFKGENISGEFNDKTKELVRNGIQMIFQDPMSSLNPRKTVLDIVSEGLLNLKRDLDKKEVEKRVAKVLEQVGLSPDFITRYPHQFSGGQRQRIGIARAIIMNPDLIICDEAISALDVSIQAQVVNLLQSIQKQTGVTLLFIAHDLSMVRYISDNIGVMHYGHLVEIGDKLGLFKNPIHPYTKSLISAIPHPNPKYERNRKSLRYLYDESGIDYTKGEYISLNDSHKVFATNEEIELWRNNKYEKYLTSDL